MKRTLVREQRERRAFEYTGSTPEELSASFKDRLE
jgi:hypothetical protein